jgi:hypothetical protein
MSKSKKKTDINNYVAAKNVKPTEQNKQSRLLFALNLPEGQFRTKIEKLCVGYLLPD